MAMPQPHSLGFGEKRRMGLCIHLWREEAPTASTPGVKRSGTVMVEMSGGGALG